MVGTMDVAIGSSSMVTSMILGVDGTTGGCAMGWDKGDGSELLPMCLSIEGTPDQRMVIERAAGKGMVREVFSEVSSTGFRYERYRSNSDGVVYKDMELVGTR